MINTQAPVAGEYGLLVPFLRQAWQLRNSSNPALRREMRADVKKCVRLLRHNRRLATKT